MVNLKLPIVLGIVFLPRSVVKLGQDRTTRFFWLDDSSSMADRLSRGMLSTKESVLLLHSRHEERGVQIRRAKPANTLLRMTVTRCVRLLSIGEVGCVPRLL